MKVKILIIILFLLLPGIHAEAGMNSIGGDDFELDGQKISRADNGTLSCLSVSFIPQLVLCGTTEMTALVNCNFTGTVKMVPIGNPPGVSLPGGDLQVINGIFTFEIEIEEGAPSYFDILTTVTATYVDEEGCVQDEVCEPSTLIVNCAIPDNNDCSAALEIALSDNDCDYEIYSNNLSTASGLNGNCTATSDHDVYFSFQASHEITHISFGELCSNSMTLELYASCSSSSLYCISMGSFTDITLPELTPGETYILRISDLQGDDQGTFEMCLWSPHVCDIAISTQTLGNEICLDDCQGEATLSINAGTAPFTFNWSNGEITDSIQNLCAGTYTVEVRDDFGCIARDTVIIEPGMLFQAEAGEDQSICQGDSLQLHASEGNNFRWSPSNGLDDAYIANPIASPLENTTYTLSILNEWGCKASDSIEILVHPKPEPTILGDSLSCASDTIDLNAGAGYQAYLWNGGETSQVNWVSDSGNYSVEVIDSNACRGVDSIYVEFLPPLQSEYEVVHEYGNAFNNGSISAQISGGMAPYSLWWNQGDTSAIINNLSPGTYTLDITDNFGCFRSDSIVIDSFTCPPFTLTYEHLDAGCDGGCEGSIELLEVENALMPLLYSWSNGESTALTDSLCPGNYSVLITDSLNCSLQEEFEILDQGDLDLILEEIVHAYSNAGGSIDISIGENILVNWAGPNNFESDSEDIYDLLPGCYTLFATDTLSGCSENTTYCIQDLTSTGFVHNLGTDFRVFPQPAKDIIHIEWLLNKENEAVVSLFTLEGEFVGKSIKYKNRSDIRIPISHLPNGLYLLQIQSVRGRTFQKCLISR
jgi:hypothetical protein